jgi:Concanavalin A-like lectin/glucanases superfamily
MYGELHYITDLEATKKSYMKTRAVAFLLFPFYFFICCNKTSTPSEIDLNNGLLAYYPFNGNANDQSTNKLNGIIQGGVVFAPDASGKPNSAASFDGSSGYILVPDSSGKLSPPVISVSLLVNLRDVTKRAALINKVNFQDATGLSYSVGIPYDNTNEFECGMVPSGYDCNTSAYNVSAIAIYNGYTILPNRWYSIVATFSDSVQKLYIDGSLKTAITRNYGTMNQCSNNKTFQMGGWWKNDIISINGSLDEVRVYNRELNQDEITELAKPVK